MPYAAAKMTRVGLSNSGTSSISVPQVKTETLNLNYVGQVSKVDVYQTTGSSNDPLIKNGELFYDNTTEQITLSYLRSSTSGRSDYSVTAILKKNGINNWSGSLVFQSPLPVGECADAFTFSFDNPCQN
jgi:hypothetical protein